MIATLLKNLAQNLAQGALWGVVLAILFPTLTIFKIMIVIGSFVALVNLVKTEICDEIRKG